MEQDQATIMEHTALTVFIRLMDSGINYRSKKAIILIFMPNVLMETVIQVTLLV